MPYCTGDLHWGNASVEYLPTVTVEHRGAVNARAAVDWMQVQLPSPQVLLVTGCSAGAYASLLWAANLAPLYTQRGTQLVQFGDSGMGIVTDAFVRDAYPNWNAAANFPWHVVPAAQQYNRTNADFARAGLDFSSFYVYAATAYPQARWSQYTSAYDENQAFFLEAMEDEDTSRGEPTLAAKLAWNRQMRDSYNSSALLSLPNYAHWIGGGDEHCVIPFNRFWWKRAGSEWSSGEYGSDANVTLNQWLSQMLDGGVVRPVDCKEEGADACTRGVELVP